MSLHNDDKRVNTLTGLSEYSILMTFFHIVAPFLKLKSDLTCFQQYMLTLIKLRMNLSFESLAFYFDIDSTTVDDTMTSVWEAMLRFIVFPCQVLVLTSSTEETTITLVLDNSNATPHWYLPALSKGYYLVLHSCFFRIVLPGFTLPVILPTSHSLDCTPSGNDNFTHRSSNTLHTLFYPNPSMLMNTW